MTGICWWLSHGLMISEIVFWRALEKRCRRFFGRDQWMYEKSCRDTSDTFLTFSDNALNRWILKAQAQLKNVDVTSLRPRSLSTRVQNRLWGSQLWRHSSWIRQDSRPLRFSRHKSQNRGETQRPRNAEASSLAFFKRAWRHRGLQKAMCALSSGTWPPSDVVSTCLAGL